MIRQPEDLAREGLESFCETVLGDILSDASGVSLSDLSESLARKIVLLEPWLRQKTNRFLRRLATHGGMIRYGSGLHRFSRMSACRREAVLCRILDSMRSIWCGIAQSLYRQVVFAASVQSGTLEPSGIAATTDEKLAEHSLFEVANLRPGQKELACDWLVVGSGPAGSVMAAELAESGQSVLLVDQGSLLANGQRLTELEASRRLIETFNSWSQQAESVLVSAGRTFGGGSVVNWGTCLDPPQKVLEKWSAATGSDFSEGSVFRHSLFAVRRRLFLKEPVTKNPANELLEVAARRLGLDVRPVESNIDECPDCVGCQFGCSTGNKKDMRSTWQVDAARLGVFLLPNCRVDRLKMNGRKAVSAVAQIANRGFDSQEVEIRFRNVVLAAGAIHSPSILMRSGFASPHLGKHLAVHPSVIVPAVFSQPLLWRGGPIQSCVVDATEQSIPSAPSVILENSFFARGLAMMCLPWRSSTEFGAMAKSIACWTGTLVLAGDQKGGFVKVDKAGRPVVNYQLGDGERRGLERGVGLAIKIMLEAGAIAAYQPAWRFGGAGVGQLPGPASGKMQKLWSAHQMGTCRMSDSPQRGVVNTEGQVFGLENVHVCDAGVFPSSAGVNPMVTVCAISHFLAQQIKQRVC